MLARVIVPPTCLTPKQHEEGKTRTVRDDSEQHDAISGMNFIDESKSRLIRRRRGSSDHPLSAYEQTRNVNWPLDESNFSLTNTNNLQFEYSSYPNQRCSPHDLFQYERRLTILKQSDLKAFKLEFHRRLVLLLSSQKTTTYYTYSYIIKINEQEKEERKEKKKRLNRYSIESSTSSSSASSSSNISSTSNNNHDRITTFLSTKTKPAFPSTANVSHRSIPKSTTFDMFNVEENYKIVTPSSIIDNNKVKDDYQSTQSLNPPPPPAPRVIFRINPPPRPSTAQIQPISRFDCLSFKPSIMMNLSMETMKQQQKKECWLSCEELETIEKRFTDLLETKTKSMSSNRAKSCERLRSTNNNDDEQSSTITRKSLVDDHSLKKTIAYHPANILNNNSSKILQHHYSKQLTQTIKTDDNNLVVNDQDVCTIESSYKSIGSKVFSCKCIVELFITTSERLSKLEDWIFFQRGLPIWLFNTGINPKRMKCLSIVLTEKGSGFPIWQDIITYKSDVKYARDQHITFRLSDQKTLAVLRFTDLQQSKKFFNYYLQLKNDQQHMDLFQSHVKKLSSQSRNRYLTIDRNNRSASCGAVLNKRVSKSSISNPCHFQHITRIQLSDRKILTTLSKCLPPSVDI
ncbi:unnamed protein product [Didymodactylos carnosus]|uniref:Uncharacterized protein n=1 Tax=Didymodactylos carnosus TaxID=1234261 RepID=A0A813QPL5_9BILA|nr:unnamed protein product [Didymodactylos carnosus]CAF0870258.1 unnamed protein product [Didymodactylos carnosus]CAF3552084.1 unnamed protein product [Didymodactylos carnosus]CAF3655058.1 unnamed protein product [Didymodactylos carnosus]